MPSHPAIYFIKLISIYSLGCPTSGTQYWPGVRSQCSENLSEVKISKQITNQRGTKKGGDHHKRTHSKVISHIDLVMTMSGTLPKIQASRSETDSLRTNLRRAKWAEKCLCMRECNLSLVIVYSKHVESWTYGRRDGLWRWRRFGATPKSMP